MLHRLVFSLFLLYFAPAWADQTDPELDALFTNLQRATNDREIRLTEYRIWEIWLSHADSQVEILMQIGIERMNTEAYDDALLIFSQLINRYPNYAEAWNKRATLYYLAGDYVASIRDIEATLQLEPRHFGALSGLGLVYLQQGELTEARDAFAALLEVHPNSPNAKENLDLINEQLRLSVI